MADTIPGIHHITAITSDAQRNIDFYPDVLGLRLVKLTVNFDDPESYHLYYGDELGRPGTILTFFACPEPPRGRQGPGQATVAAFSIPLSALGFWLERFTPHGVHDETPKARFAEKVIAFKDPDGLMLELVTDTQASQHEAWQRGPVPANQPIRGFHSVTVWEEGYERTAQVLTDTVGLHLLASDKNIFRYVASGDQGPGTCVYARCVPGFWRGAAAAGTMHHVAWRTPDDASQFVWRDWLVALGLNVTPVIDRRYFHSIYFREPGGVLFEIATVPPSFTVDEPPESLGSALKLPAWFEPDRQGIQAALPPIHLPTQADHLVSS